MKVLRFITELALMTILAGVLLIGVVLIAEQLFSEKVQYFTIGYYMAIHVDVVRWIWRRLGFDRPFTSPEISAKTSDRRTIASGGP